VNARPWVPNKAFTAGACHSQEVIIDTVNTSAPRLYTIMIHSGGPISVNFGSVEDFINNQMLTTVIYQLTSSD